MIVVRNVFRIKFGQARAAVAAWKEGMAIAGRTATGGRQHRLLTDLVGPDFYTLVFESTYDSLSEFERSAQTLMAAPDWQAWYPKAAALSEGGYREILNLVE